MIENKWFCEPNNQRECWSFLIIKRDNSDNDFKIKGWDMGYANPGKIIRKIKNKKIHEKEIINELLNEIYYCRKNTIKIITFEANIFPIIRTRIVLQDIGNVSLRGIKYLSVEKLLAEYFLFKEMKIAANKINDIEMLRNIFLKIGPMLPEGVL